MYNSYQPSQTVVTSANKSRQTIHEENWDQPNEDETDSDMGRRKASILKHVAPGLGWR